MSAEIQVLPYRAKSYLAEGGGRLIYRDMIRRGMPSDFTGWLMVTLTLDRKLFDDEPEAGYICGKKRMRLFFQYLERHGFDIPRWIWKLEFHPDSPEWVHWHLLLDTRRFIDWSVIKRAWNLGGVDVERIEHGENFHYEFKYVFKDGMEPPEWLLKYKRIRFIQTKGIFERKPKEKKRETVEEELNRKEDEHAETGKDNRSEAPTIGQRLASWKYRITAVYDTQDGKQIRAYELEIPTELFFARLWKESPRTRTLWSPFHASIKNRSTITQYVRKYQYA